MLQKKLMILCAAGILAAGSCFGGCQKSGSEEPAEPAEPTKQAQTGSPDGGEAAEPALTDEAKKIKQFSDMTEGEIYARINIQDFGTITVKFFPEEAPLAVENFITHAKEGYYDGITIHRTIADFMFQSGDPDGTGRGGESIWGESFQDEFSSELHPYRGALCMANTGAADTNGSQFFIVQADASSVLEMEALLDAQYGISLAEYVEAGYGTELTQEQVERYEIYGGTPWLYRHHTVFGQVMEGYDVLDAVADVDTDANDRPLETIVIESVEILEY